MQCDLYGYIELDAPLPDWNDCGPQVLVLADEFVRSKIQPSAGMRLTCDLEGENNWLRVARNLRALDAPRAKRLLK
jgi:hypothetical protein